MESFIHPMSLELLHSLRIQCVARFLPCLPMQHRLFRLFSQVADQLLPTLTFMAISTMSNACDPLHISYRDNHSGESIRFKRAR